MRDYVRSCQSCQQNKSSSKRPMGLLNPLPIPEERWESVSLYDGPAKDGSRL